MKSAKRTNAPGLSALLMLLVASSIVMTAPNVSAAKSLYLIADIMHETTGTTQPVHVYGIEAGGTLAFQSEHQIPHIMLGAVGMAVDSDSGYLFVTFEGSNDVLLLDTLTMEQAGRVSAEGATDLAGIVYDHRKELLYCVDRGQDKLYVYDWNARARTLSPVPGSPFYLKKAQTFGIALDELAGLLYVANARYTVNVYDTSDWSLADTIGLEGLAISIAVDSANGIMYTGAGYAGDHYLTQYHLATGKQARLRVEPDAGVIGLAVDPDTSLVYMSTGMNNAPGGDNLLVYDAALNLLDTVHIDGSPTGLAIPGLARRPLNLTKTVGGSTANQMGQVSIDEIVTYTLKFDNNDADFDATDILLVDLLPKEVNFVSADDTVSGWYDDASHSFTWSLLELAPGPKISLDLVVQVKQNVPLGAIISNSAIISSNETAPSIVTADAIVVERPLQVQSMHVIPDRIRRTGSSEDIQAVMIMPPGIGRDDIDDVLPMLQPGNVKATRQVVFGTASRSKVIAIFDKAEIVDAITDYGQMTFKVVGKLKSGKSYAGEAIVYMTRFTGN